jgi:hypothetical protein
MYEPMPILIAPRFAFRVVYGPMNPGALTITALPLVILDVGSMKVASFAGVPYGKTGVFGRTAGVPTGSCNKE